MDKESKKKRRTPARRKRDESQSDVAPENPERAKDSRRKRRKRGDGRDDETPGNGIRVSEVAGPTSSPVGGKAKRTTRGEGPSPLAKRRKKEVKEQDVGTVSSSSNAVPTSTETRVVRKRNPKRKAEDHEEPRRGKKAKKAKKTETEERTVDSPIDQFQEKYTELHELGIGGFGSVFAGYRVKDKLPVAIKHISKDNVHFKHEDGNGNELPLEVAVMLKLRDVTQGQSAIVALLDWYDLDQELILVMERPMPSDDLLAYIRENGCLNEEAAKTLMKQLVEVLIPLQKANIFHRDIKIENILIEIGPEVPRVFLIDFGLSCFDDGKEHDLYCGTLDHIPMDWYNRCKYRAGPTTVWQLGVVLFEVLHRARFQTFSYFTNRININKQLSNDCQDFLTKCLMAEPEDRPTLEELLCHPWFS